MGVKITVEVTCSGCGKKLSLEGREVYGRRRNYVHVDDLWGITGISRGVEIIKGLEASDIREKQYDEVCCSILCILKCLPKPLKKYEKEKRIELIAEKVDGKH